MVKIALETGMLTEMVCKECCACACVRARLRVTDTIIWLAQMDPDLNALCIYETYMSAMNGCAMCKSPAYTGKCCNVMLINIRKIS